MPETEIEFEDRIRQLVQNELNKTETMTPRGRDEFYDFMTRDLDCAYNWGEGKENTDVFEITLRGDTPETNYHTRAVWRIVVDYEKKSLRMWD